MTEEVCNLLGEALLLQPATASSLIRSKDLHRLMELTGGTVYLRRRDWRIIPQRAGHLHVRIELKRER